MEIRSVQSVGEYVGTMKPGEDWRAELEAMYTAADADAAWFTAIGGVTDAEVSFYDQTDCSYGPTMFDEPMEVASCVGNVAQIAGDESAPYAHTHVVLARSDGSVVAGHLNTATVFVGEVYMRVFDTEFTREAAETPVLQTDESWEERVNDGGRETDPITGLQLWK